MHVVRAVAHAGRDDDVVRVELPVLVSAAVGGEGAPGGAAALAGALDIGLDGLDVDKIGRLGPVAALTTLALTLTGVLAVARVLTVALVITLALVIALALILALVLALAVVLATTAVTTVTAIAAVAAFTRISAGVAGGAVVGAQAASGETFDPRGALSDASDRDADAVEARRPLVPQRAEHGVLGEPGVPGYLLLPVGELPVGIGDLGIHRREFAVDLGARLLGHVGQFVTGIGTVDGGHLAARVLGPGGGRRSGRPFPRGGVDVDRHQPAPAQDQGCGGGYGPVGQA